jgi:hypothetical protein
MVNKEQDIIIDKAIEKLGEQTGIIAEWAPHHEDMDGEIAFRYNNELYRVPVEVKKELRAHQMTELIRLKEKHGKLMLMAQYIYPKLKQQLRDEGIAYLETNGNMYIRQDALFLWLDNAKMVQSEKAAPGRAFGKTGLKLLFHFLIDEQLINLTYREIASKTGVSFGNINFIIVDLKEQGFLLPANKATYILAQKSELLHKWVKAYKERLQPALEIGTFRFVDKENYFRWEDIALKPGKYWWGGEPAGGILTNYLQPEEFTIYTTQKRADIIKDYRLLPDKEGKIKVYQKFWQFTEPGVTAPPLLVYADLINTNEGRCIETAERIYHEYLQTKF